MRPGGGTPHPCRSFGWRFFLAGIPKFIQDLLGFVGPFASQYIIEWLSDADAPYYVGFAWALALFFGPFLQTMFVNQYFTLTFNTGMHVRRVHRLRVRRASPRVRPDVLRGGVRVGTAEVGWGETPAS